MQDLCCDSWTDPQEGGRTMLLPSSCIVKVLSWHDLGYVGLLLKCIIGIIGIAGLAF